MNYVWNINTLVAIFWYYQKATDMNKQRPRRNRMLGVVPIATPQGKPSNKLNCISVKILIGNWKTDIS